jgi:hypothetical protein
MIVMSSFTENGNPKPELKAAANEKATRQRRQPFLSRENSSNGGKIRQNFLAKSYEPKNPRVNKFLGNK